MIFVEKNIKNFKHLIIYLLQLLPSTHRPLFRYWCTVYLSDNLIMNNCDHKFNLIINANNKLPSAAFFALSNCVKQNPVNLVITSAGTVDSGMVHAAVI